MGVDYSYYLFVGVNLINEEYPDDGDWIFETLEDEINGVPGVALDCIYDGMSGEYAYLGKTLASVDEYTEDVKELDPNINKVVDDVVILLDQFDPAWRSKYGPVKVFLITHAH